MLGGRAPFDGQTLPEVCARIMAEPPAPLREARPDLPPELEAVVMRCLEKDVAKRYPDVAGLARGLAPFGAPEMTAAAERIARLVRAHGAPSTETRDAESTGPVAAAAVSGMAHTAASFTTSDALPARRPAKARWAVGGGLVALVAAVALGLVATRGRRLEPPASPITPVVAAPVPSPASPPPEPSAVLPSAVASVAPSAAPPSASSAPVPQAPPATAQSPSPPRSQPRARPAAPPSSAKPAGTTGFGGRD
jgi:serine/threonine-protein kinase